MSQASSVALAVVDSDTFAAAPATVTLKGTTRGLEIHVVAAPSAAALGARLTELLAEAPSFFAGSDARVAFEGTLPTGALACLEDVAAKFELKLVEVVPVTKPARSYAAVVRRVDAARRSKLAEGTGPIADGQPAQATAELPALPAEQVAAASVDAAWSDAMDVAGSADAAAPDDAAPVEVALANTAPYASELSGEQVPLGDSAVRIEAAALDAGESPTVLEAPIAVSALDAWAIETALAGAVSIDAVADDDDDGGLGDVAVAARFDRATTEPATELDIETPARRAAAIEIAVAHATEAVDAMAASAAPSVTDPAIIAAATAMAEDLALTMAGELVEAKARALAAQMTGELVEAKARVLAVQLAERMAEQMIEARVQARAGELAAARAQELALVLAEELAQARAPELAAALAEQLAEVRAAKLLEPRAAELASKLADEIAETRAARLVEARAAELAGVLAAALADARAKDLVAAMPPGPRLVIGQVRSGVIVDHPGHVIVIGDVNPGAEVRAEGSIIVLGRLRGVAHAAMGREAGCIVALSLQPQQLRIGRMVARAGAGDRPSDGAEIAYLTGETIVVERFLGRLPSGLAASM